MIVVLGCLKKKTNSYLLRQRVLTHKDESALLRAYIAEWGKFFTQCNYLPKPFNQLEANLLGKLHSSMPKKTQSGEESLVRKVRSV